MPTLCVVLRAAAAAAAVVVAAGVRSIHIAANHRRKTHWIPGVLRSSMCAWSSTQLSVATELSKSRELGITPM